MKKQLGSTFLFAQPSFATGVARLIDWGLTINEYNTSPSDAAADNLALYSDWKNVGNDMRKALEQYKLQSR